VDGTGRAAGPALAGVALISSSAVVMRLAGTSASITALGRCLFALPVLGVLVLLERRPRGGPAGQARRGAPLAPRTHWLARLSGLFLAADLVLWSHSIAAIGAGLGTVVPSLQVLIIAGIGWALLGERPHRSLLLASPVMLGGLVLVGGLTGAHAYGAHPALGVAEGAGVAALYSMYILTLRQATTGSGKPSPVATLYEATLGATAGSLVLGLALRDLRFGPGPVWPAIGWLVLLALTSQVAGWLLITMSMPRLPAWMIGALLLVQPAGSVTLGYLILSERPSLSQLAGVALMLTGVLVAVAGHPAQHQVEPPRAGGADREVVVEVPVPGDGLEAAG
jgi:drug/metabolite transporter (DMT)-like permease